MRRGDDQARDELRQAMDEIERNGLTQFRHVPLAYCALALAEARAGRFEPSLQASTHAEKVFRDLEGVVRAQIHYRLILADAAIARNDWPTANRVVREAVALLPLEPDAAMLHEWADHLVQRCARRTTSGTQVDLTPAERRVLEQLASHYTLGEIADHLYVSRNTIKTHTVSIYRKLLVSGRSEAVARAGELGLLDGGLEERAIVTAR
jgi:LuxR family maltose regulon positive regulatory protein